VPQQGRLEASSMSSVGQRHASCRRDRFSNNGDIKESLKGGCINYLEKSELNN
jgi:hypothetical protein